MAAVLLVLEGLVFRLLWVPLLHRWYGRATKRKADKRRPQFQQGVLL